ncbi:streptavidin-like [Paramacrobiotus metropolitanus]|uniref:streptavidin-like n=1 Tax=Paramacrobiotus metropolitanus TaxID=2943436 RepID=UPI002445CBD1|nr:streptavidin-like [Paramacrobiotus metropolitanus]
MDLFLLFIALSVSLTTITAHQESNSLKDLLSSGKSNRATNAACSDISGNWYNQHGSEIIFTPGAKSSLSGTFASTVSLYKNKRPTADPVNGKLVGYLQRDGSFGFAVIWDNASNQTTAYSGNCYPDENGEILIAAWHLAEKQHSIGDAWKGFRSGQDIFTRRKRLHHFS